ncbi:hypothetical protein C7C46_27425 [Streptomyces tateyamensis]|uniref:DUF4034 domain-containing protein n=1 Tax=Streptomyces tateyamensis TaxID=565073 RepID=A0A2V4NZC4_9ACTN|nr:hypothetical protein [Streptomyces tateyamensis]PYC70207.1 hypothetical protein C7C46_27425 [Streptomyces tateyamensis]
MRRLLGRLRPGARLAVDPACGDPLLAELRAAAGGGDWAAVRAGLARAGDQGDLTTMVAQVADVAGVEEWIPQAVAAEPDSALPLLVSGARQVSWAWEARSGSRAQYVTREQWQLFHQRLETAEEQLYQVAEREPEWLGPWYFLQISGRGESLDKEAATYRFEAAVRRFPGHPASHRQRLQQLCRKWGGSHEQMHEFARSSMLGAPEGSQLGELVALAHLEHWLDLERGADAGHITSQPVRLQLAEAAQRSVLHPGYVRGRGWAATHNTFAMVLSLAGERNLARAVFAQLGDTVTKSPWDYLSKDPVEAFRLARKECA